MDGFHDRFDNTFAATICGVDLTIHETSVVNVDVTTDRAGHLLFQATIRDARRTDAAGDRISLSNYGAAAKDISVVDDPDGGFTVTFTIDRRSLWVPRLLRSQDLEGCWPGCVY